MNGDDILALLASVGALITNDHLVYTSGRHGSSYVNKDALYPHTAATAAVCERIARRFTGAGVEVVAGPAIGGVILAQWTAYHLSALEGREVLAVYAEEETAAEGKRRVLRRGYDALTRGRRVLVVEDVLTTGGSARQVVEAVQAAGGEVIGVGALCNRGGVTADTVAVPELFALVDVPLESYGAEDCPLCAAGVPINTQVGKGAAYVRERPGRS
ncbi:MAG: phosphoribosyltransferase family protein [Oscillochloridaceae bacterium]|nr:phosphoribosyltransferase family protein [Chloroflexaceae bacterium]MDW8388639.1 phosphoribosyltransferase family protein [Oscillochloridaceae bacterium]